MKARIPKILLVSRSVPPAVNGSSAITGNLVKQFSREEMVVIGAKFMRSPQIEWSKQWPRLVYATLHLPDGLRGDRWFRWAQWPLLVLRMLWTVIINKCEVVLATYPDEIYLLTAYVVASLTRKPLYLYFHNTYLEHARFNPFAGWLQPRAFARARHVFVMSEGMEALYRRYYPDLVCSPLLHSFNEPIPNIEALLPLKIADNSLCLALSGAVNASNSGAVRHIAQAVREMTDVQFTIYSRTDPHYLAQLGFDGPQFSIRTLSRDELLKQLAMADILVLPHGFSDKESVEEIQTIFPTRTIEYLISGRPILAHVPQDCFIADFLRQYECALLVTEPDIHALQEGIRRLKTEASLREQLVRNALVAATQFQASQVASHLREILQST
jgi:glycosyltransferase involved in cell wall biosynthesis